MTDDLKRLEEEKRERNWDTVEWWRIIQETIAWADAQQPIQRNTPEACLRDEARKLGREYPPKKS